MNKLLTAKAQTIINRRSTGASLPPCVRIGRLVRYPLDGVEAWIAAQAEQPLQPPLPQALRPGRHTEAEQIAPRREVEQ